MPIEPPQINEKILRGNYPELNDMEIGGYRAAHEAYFMAIDAFAGGTDEDFRSALDTALTVVFESKQKLGHLTIYHPIYRKVAGMDLMLQKILCDNFPSGKAEAEFKRMLEFHVAKYGDSGIAEMVII